MKRLLFLCFLLFISVSLFSQNKIPRRIIYKLNIKELESDLISLIPEILNARINDYYTVIPVGEKMRHHNSISISKDGSKYFFVLKESSGKTYSYEYLLSDANNLESVEIMCTELAFVWKDYLNLAEPFVEVAIAEKRDDLSKGASFEESLATLFQISFWATAVRTAIDMDTAGSKFGLFFPVITDFDWYLKERVGFNLSFFGDVSKFMSFGSIVLGQDHSIAGESFNIALIPGIGITFRSLGRISGNYGFNFYAGLVRISALEDLVNTRGESQVPILSEGESKWIFFPLFSLKSGISWNININWSIKTRFVLFLSPLAFSDNTQSFGYDPQTGAVLFTIIQAGLGYRW